MEFSYIKVAGVMGFTGVTLGAFGAHGLRKYVSAKLLESWAIGVQYQLIHSVSILALSLYVKHLEEKSASVPSMYYNALRAWSCGVALFSGSIYALVLGAPGIPFGPITPIGGLTMMTGWAFIALS
eukprot:Tbor_TRINITY_DN3524_c0_g1::TRINITY_DN3524_c0_g1_i1::g.2837::m.2837